MHTKHIYTHTHTEHLVCVKLFHFSFLKDILHFQCLQINPLPILQFPMVPYKQKMLLCEFQQRLKYTHAHTISLSLSYLPKCIDVFICTRRVKICMCIYIHERTSGGKRREGQMKKKYLLKLWGIGKN